MEQLNQFTDQAYLSLETYRKNGAAMPTPVWFAQVGNYFYVSTFNNAGKVKRIRSNPAVRINPCGMQGEIFGQWVSATAHLAENQEVETAEAALDAKYGERRREFMRQNPLPPERRAYLVIYVSPNP